MHIYHHFLRIGSAVLLQHACVPAVRRCMHAACTCHMRIANARTRIPPPVLLVLATYLHILSRFTLLHTMLYCRNRVLRAVHAVCMHFAVAHPYRDCTHMHTAAGPACFSITIICTFDVRIAVRDSGLPRCRICMLYPSYRTYACVAQSGRQSHMHQQRARVWKCVLQLIYSIYS